LGVYEAPLISRVWSLDYPASAGLSEIDCRVNTELTKDMGYSGVLKIAMEVEENAYKFCTDAGEMSGSLLANIPQAFERIAINQPQASTKATSRQS